MTAEAPPVPQGCSARCAPGEHHYDARHPFPHPAEVQVMPGPEPVEPPTTELPMPSRDRGPYTLPPPPARPLPPPAPLVDPEAAAIGVMQRQVRTYLEQLPTEQAREAFRDEVLRHVPLPARVEAGLPYPPHGYGWAVAVSHALPGSEGPAHLVPLQTKDPHILRSWCGLQPVAWVMVGRFESVARVSCNACALQRITS